MNIVSTASMPFGAAKDAAKAVAGTTKRRPLGEITNVVSGIDPGQVKKVGLPKRPLLKVPIVEIDQEQKNNRNYMTRSCDDVDERDKDNILAVADYVEEIYIHLRAREGQFMVITDYMAMQEFINIRMRTILVDWLVEVHLKFKLIPEALYLSITILDRYLELKPVRRSRLQLVGVTALFIAAKYEEIYPPELKLLEEICDMAYNQNEMLAMEMEIIVSLGYQFMYPTIHSFLCRALKAAHADRQMVQLSCYLSERMLQEYSMLPFPPSMIAATAVMVARKSLNRHPWSPTLLKYTGYDECDLAACAMEMKKVMVAEVTNPSGQHAVFRKYKHDKFGAVATLSLVF